MCLCLPRKSSGLLVTGIPNHCVEDLSLEDCEIQFTGGFSANHEKLSPPNQADIHPELESVSLKAN
jgi:hypothetical protein